MGSNSGRCLHVRMDDDDGGVGGANLRCRMPAAARDFLCCFADLTLAVSPDFVFSAGTRRVSEMSEHGPHDAF